MARIINDKEIQSILYSKLQESNWDNVMRTYVKSSEFLEVINTLLKEVTSNNRFTPPMKDLFNPFTYCKYEDLKVVFIGDEPNNAIGVADGLAFSSPNSLSKELPLRVLHNKIAEEVYSGKRKVSDFNTDLRVWSEQGVLLLNSALTAVINKTHRHTDLWKPLISHMIDMLNSEKTKLIYVLFGENAEYFSDLIDMDENYVYQLDLPGSNGYKWDSENIFNEINELLEQNHKYKIAW